MVTAFTYTLAGKWRIGEAGVYHPLLFHILDAAAVANEIWNSCLGPHARGHIAQTLGADEEITGRIISFWVGLHDLGKASPTFQGLNDSTRASLEKLEFPFPDHPQKFPHNVVTTKVLADVLASVHRGCAKAVLKNVATAVGGHHGSFPQSDELSDARLPADEVGSGIWEEARRDLTASLARLLGVNDVKWPPPDGLADDNYPFFATLAGFTSVADWIASDENHFPHSPPPYDVARYWDDARHRAAYVIKETLRWGRWQNADEPSTFFDAFPALNTDNKLEPFPIQAKIAALAETLDGPALVVVEAPMGEGKTEAALYLADHWLRKPGAEGFYVALPTMATSNQMFGRVRKFLDGRLKGQTVNLHLLHGQAPLVKEYEELKPNVAEPDTNDEDEAVIAAEWFTSKKRGLISPFGVGTVDQALMAVLQVRHVFVRLFGLAHKVVIVDEVHAYDAYMSTLLERLLAWLAGLGAPVILLSATLPKKKRLELLKAYAGDDSTKTKDTWYPRISVARPGKKVKVIPVKASPERERTVRVERVETDAAAVADRLADALKDGGCAAVICNTVARSQEMYETLRKHFKPDNPFRNERGELGLLHARFPFGWRQEREKRYLTVLGKDGERPAKFVLVGTQVLEQSLDLDFDLMVTDLGPGDLVLQRMGRLHRHRRDGRPKGLTTPALWVMWPKGDAGHIPDFGASAYVYEPYILLRSWLTLDKRREIKVPGELEEIIEEVYGDGDLQGLSELWENALEAAKTDHDRKLEVQETEAETRVIKRPTFSGALARVAQYSLAEDAPEYHPYHQALTRLGGPSVTVICLHRVNGAVSLDPEGKCPVDWENLAAGEKTLVNNLLSAAVPLSHRGIVPQLITTPPPPAWRRNAYLRNCRPLEFENGRAVVGKWVLVYDEDLGLKIDKEDVKREDE